MAIQLQLQLQAQAGITSNKPAADHAAAAPLMGDEEANIPNDGAHQADINAAGSSSWLPAFLGFLFLTLNSGLAIDRSRGDAATVAFVCFAYADLVALFSCLRWYESALAAGSAERTTLKVAVWSLTTALTLAFLYKVAAVMPLPVAVHLWLMAATTVAGGFYAFFIYEETESQTLRRQIQSSRRSSLEPRGEVQTGF
ncbi:unnamed protein product [Urochloa decumbens]|uniref:Uncharacterized protein n=1 Tax=Urochloa decumbens TaxID=240449 RepID=A0ABC8VG58_9POAL